MDNNTFSKTIKGENINLIGNSKNIFNDTELCNIFKGFFCNIISELKDTLIQN